LGVSWGLLGAPCSSWEVLVAEDENTQTLHAEKNSEMHYAQRLKRISGKTATAEHHWQIDFGTSSGRLFPTVAPWKISARKIKRRAPGGSLGPKTENTKKRCAEKERNTLRTKAQTRFPKKRRLRNTTGRSILGGAQGRLFPTVAPWKISARKIKKSQERAVQHSNWLRILPVDGGRRLSFCPSSLLT
jgi:hypothetical protein